MGDRARWIGVGRALAVAGGVLAASAAGAQVEHPWFSHDENYDSRLSPEEFALAMMSELKPLDVNGDGAFTRSEFLTGKTDEELYVHTTWFDENDVDADGLWSVGELEEYLVFRFLQFDADEDSFLTGDEFPETRPSATARL